MRGKTPSTKTDILIIGAGVMGASIAFQLSKRTDKQITIVDQFPPLGGMSGRTFGQIRLHYSNALLLEMAMHGVQYFDNWDSEVGYGDPGYVRMGYLLIVVEKQLEALQRNIDLASSLGIKTTFVSPEQIKKIEPAINTTSLVGGVHDPAGGYIDVTRIVLSFLTAAQERGVQLRSNVRVEAIETKSGRVSSVSTTMGNIKAPVVINTTGSWANELLKPLGITLSMEPRRLDTMYLKQPAGRTQIGCCITDGNSNVAIRPDMGRDFLVGAYPQLMPLALDPAEGCNDKSDAEHMVRIRKSLAERFPDLVDAVPIRSVSGTYDITPDWHPIIGWAPEVEGMFIATGFSGHGLKLAPAVGEVVSSIVLDKAPKFDIHPLRAQRFVENEPMFLAYGPGGRA